MRKYIILFACSLFYLSFLGCFDDEGSYDYKELNSPVIVEKGYFISGIKGGMVQFEGHKYYSWERDSAIREMNVRFEWKFYDVVISDKADFKMSTDSLLQLVSQEPFRRDGHPVVFSIIDETGVPYSKVCYLMFTSSYDIADWVILSDDAGKANYSFIKRSRGTNPTYELTQDVFKTANGFDIVGKPIGLFKSTSAYIGALGAITLLTDQAAYVLNALDQKVVNELKNEFLDGTPNNFNVVARRECDNLTYLTTSDGRLFKREMSANSLGGQFLSEPYVVDDLGYNITLFGQAPAGKKNFSCYDEKNKRVLMGSFVTTSFFEVIDGQWFYRSYTKHLISPLNQGAAKDDYTPVWRMPEGTKMLYLTTMAYSRDFSNMYTILYNDQSGNTYMADFMTTVDGSTCATDDRANLKPIPFPGGNLTKESIFLYTTNNWYGAETSILYTKGNEIRYIDRNLNNGDNDFLRFNAKVTSMSYSTADYEEFKRLFVGLEDGRVFIYDISNKRSPLLVKEFKVAGKVVSMKSLGQTSMDDAF